MSSDETTTIVVAYDASEGARRALAHAAFTAGTSDFHLVVVRVTARFIGVARTVGPLDSADEPWAADEQLERTRSVLWGKVGGFSFVKATGDPAQMIAEVAKQRGATLIVVGAGRPSLLKRLLRQAVSEEVARRASCDVLIVR